MKPATIIGVILIALSVLSFAYQGIPYRTREKVVDLGPIQATAEKDKSIPLPPIFGAIALVGGIVLIVAGSKQN
ncbi:MAG TPA: DUF3185 domain-containing protein [Verrucomicrobiae bacterium]|jgi:hypothetical protein|nr:DUF3185 domain-containing protein [Verrucomicrobiae bacterium]